LNNFESAATSSDSDVSSSKIVGSPSGGPEEAETCPPVSVIRRPNPVSPIPEFYSVEEKTAMLGIAETAAATKFPIHAAASLFRYDDHDRRRLHGSSEVHDFSMPHSSGTVAGNENYFRVAVDEHRAYPPSNPSSFGEGSQPLHLLGKTAIFNCSSRTTFLQFCREKILGFHTALGTLGPLFLGICCNSTGANISQVFAPMGLVNIRE